MSVIAYLCAPSVDLSAYSQAIHQLDPSVEFVRHDQIKTPEAVEFAVAWQQPAGEFSSFSHLKVVMSLGAGVDHILKDPSVPSNVTIARLVDHTLREQMSEYIMMAVINHRRNWQELKAHQQAKHWEKKRAPDVQETHIGILGLGQLGQDAAKKLSTMGYNIYGWSRTPKTVDAVQSYHGQDGLAEMLPKVNVLVCLLPDTQATRNILNQNLFSQLPQGAYLINVARGAHLNEPDLIPAIDSGQLSGACLDVFKTEPLPQDHPFWTHPQITVTSHLSSISNVYATSEQILENYYRMRDGRPLNNVVDRNRGY